MHMLSVAIAYAAADDFANAIKTIQKAIDVAISLDNQKMAGELKQRIKLYKAKQPYRMPLPTGGRLSSH